MHAVPDLTQLRHLLFGKDYEELLALKAQFANSERYSASVARVIAEAIQLRARQDSSLTHALTPVLAPLLEQTLTQTIQRQPQRFASILYPVMGPALRKSIQQALNEALENLNQLLESSFSPQAWQWRWQAWRTGQPYAQVVLLRTLVYQVEQVFLIHRETGLLLHHLPGTHVVNNDPNIIAGMLTAIQDFINDSFTLADADTTLDTLRLGELTVLVEQGPHAILALVVRGTVPSELRQCLSEACETIHQQFAQALSTFNGDISAFATTEALLNRCLQAQHRPRRKRSPWLAYFAVATVIGWLGWLGWNYYQQQAQTHAAARAAQQQQQAALKALQAQTQALATTLQNLQAQQAQQQSAHNTNAARRLQSIQRLTREIEATQYPFATLQSQVDLTSPILLKMTSNIAELQELARQNNQMLQVMLIGDSDPHGSETLNQQLAQERAHNMRDALVRSGIPAALLVAYAASQPGLPSRAKTNQRAVNFRIALY
ncbi:MAG: OmpA family protein [Thiothrix sp.]